jgi:hypothetical protein
MKVTQPRCNAIDFLVHKQMLFSFIGRHNKLGKEFVMPEFLGVCVGKGIICTRFRRSLGSTNTEEQQKKLSIFLIYGFMECE